jgi:hypothetical protein
MKKTIRRISLISVVVYLVGILIGLIFIRGVGFGRFGSRSTGRGLESEVSGNVIYNVGGDISYFGRSMPFIEGTADFRITRTGIINSNEILEQIETGKIKLDPIRWEIHWIAFLLGFLQTWLIVGALFWMRRKWVSLPKHDLPI